MYEGIVVSCVLYGSEAWVKSGYETNKHITYETCSQRSRLIENETIIFTKTNAYVLRLTTPSLPHKKLLGNSRPSFYNKSLN